MLLPSSVRCCDALLQAKVRGMYGTWDRLVQAVERREASMAKFRAGGGHRQRPPWLLPVGLHVAAQVPLHARPCIRNALPAWRGDPAEWVQERVQREAAIRAELLAGGMTAEALDSSEVGDLITDCLWQVGGATLTPPTCTRLAPAHKSAKRGSLQQLVTPLPLQGRKAQAVY